MIQTTRCLSYRCDCEKNYSIVSKVEIIKLQYESNANEYYCELCGDKGCLAEREGVQQSANESLVLDLELAISISNMVSRESSCC